MSMEDEVKPGDVLRGCGKIASFIRELLGDSNISEGQCYHWLEEQYIPNSKFGGQIVTTKPRIIAALIAPASNPASSPQPEVLRRGRHPKEPQRRGR
jgi:hypothetical protein